MRLLSVGLVELVVPGLFGIQRLLYCILCSKGCNLCGLASLAKVTVTLQTAILEPLPCTVQRHWFCRVVQRRRWLAGNASTAQEAADNGALRRRAAQGRAA